MHGGTSRQWVRTPIGVISLRYFFLSFQFNFNFQLLENLKVNPWQLKSCFSPKEWYILHSFFEFLLPIDLYIRVQICLDSVSILNRRYFFNLLNMSGYPSWIWRVLQSGSWLDFGAGILYSAIIANVTRHELRGSSF
jgi:hypothetical protein